LVGGFFIGGFSDRSGVKKKHKKWKKQMRKNAKDKETGGALIAPRKRPPKYKVTQPGAHIALVAGFFSQIEKRKKWGREREFEPLQIKLQRENERRGNFTWRLQKTQTLRKGVKHQIPGSLKDS